MYKGPVGPALISFMWILKVCKPRSLRYEMNDKLRVAHIMPAKMLCCSEQIRLKECRGRVDNLIRSVKS